MVAILSTQGLQNDGISILLIEKSFGIILKQETFSHLLTWLSSATFCILKNQDKHLFLLLHVSSFKDISKMQLIIIFLYHHKTKTLFAGFQVIEFWSFLKFRFSYFGL